MGVVLILLGIQADWRPYVLVAAWLAVGLVYWALRSRSAAGTARPWPAAETPAEGQQ